MATNPSASAGPQPGAMPPKEHFSSHANEYEKMTGGCTRRIAQGFLQHIPPLTSTSSILDSATGPGIVTKLLLDQAAENGVQPPPRIVAADFAPGMVELVKHRKAEEGWDTVEPRVLDAQNLEGLKNSEFDAVTMNFALFALQDADKGAREIYRVLKPDGTAIVTTWKVSGTVDLMEKAVAAVRPNKPQKIFPVDEIWKTKEKVYNTMVAAGFPASRTFVYEVGTKWSNNSVDELLDALSGPFWEGIFKEWTEQEKQKWKPELRNALSEEETSTAAIDMIAWVCVAKKDE